MKNKKITAGFILSLLVLFSYPQLISAQQNSTNQAAIRQIFPRNQTYEYQILKALNFNPSPSLANIDLNETTKSYNQLNSLEKAFGGLALIAAEVHFMNLPKTTPESALRDISNRSIPEIRKQVVGYLGALVVNAIIKNGNDELTKALNSWATEIYKSFKIRNANGILAEYNKWKLDPCSYKAEGYKPPVDCSLKGLNFTQWFSTHKPSEDILAKAGMKSVLSGNADEIASGIALGATAVTLSASAVAVTSGLGVVVGTVLTPAGAPIVVSCTSLSAAFGGSTGMTGGAAAIGSVSWAGVVAAPVAATILAIVVGTVEGFRVVEAEKVGPMLKMKLGAAMTTPINIVNELQTNKDAVSMFYMAFIESSLKGFQNAEPKLDGEVRFYCQAGYVSQFKLSYKIKPSNPFEQEKTVDLTTNNLAVGQEQTFPIPFNAVNINIRGLYAAGDWKELFNTTLAQPTYICYTTYGTVFEPKYKNDCPEVGSMVTKPNELTVTQGGGYTAWVYLSYKQNGKVSIVQDQQGIPIGWRKVYQIPKDATEIYLYIRNATGLAWEPWKTVVEKRWPSSPNECIKIYGTTLDPKWNNECN